MSINNRPRHKSQFDEPLARAVKKKLQKKLQKFYKTVRCPALNKSEKSEEPVTNTLILLEKVSSHTHMYI